MLCVPSVTTHQPSIDDERKKDGGGEARQEVVVVVERVGSVGGLPLAEEAKRPPE